MYYLSLYKYNYAPYRDFWSNGLCKHYSSETTERNLTTLGMKHSTTIVVVQEVFRFQKFAVVPEKFDFMSQVEFCQAWDFFGFYETLLGFFLKKPKKSPKVSKNLNF
jgi:hypothetical protein